MMASFEPPENPPDVGPPRERKRPRHDCPVKIKPALEFPFITVKPTVERKRYPSLMISKPVSINLEVPAECSKRNVDSDSEDVVVFKPSGGVSKGDIKGRGYSPPRNLKGFSVGHDFLSGFSSNFSSTSRRSPNQISSKQNVDSDYDSEDVIVFKPSGGVGKGDMKGHTSRSASTSRRYPKEMNNVASSSRVNVDSLGIADECGVVDVVVSKEKCSKEDKQNGYHEMVDASQQSRVSINMIKNTLKQYWEEVASIKESRVGNEIKKNAYFAAAESLQKQRKCVNTTRCEGPISGVEVGDRFQCRGELFVIGLHRQLTKGIDTIKVDGRSIAISVVASDFYDNDMRSPGVLIYCGEGGNPRFKRKKPVDQKLTSGNLALRNSIRAKNSVRVIRCYNRPIPSEQGLKRIFVYDGLYNVEKFIQERGEIGKLVFKFTLIKVTGQPELALGTYS